MRRTCRPARCAYTRNRQVLRQHTRLRPDALRGSFGQYRAFDATIAQDQQRKNTRLNLPVLAIGAEECLGQGVIDTMKLVADDVQSVIVSGSGHWVAEQAPEQLVAARTRSSPPTGTPGLIPS